MNHHAAISSCSGRRMKARAWFHDIPALMVTSTNEQRPHFADVRWRRVGRDEPPTLSDSRRHVTGERRKSFYRQHAELGDLASVFRPGVDQTAGCYTADQSP